MVFGFRPESRFIFERIPHFHTPSGKYAHLATFVATLRPDKVTGKRHYAQELWQAAVPSSA
jgi:hypothetical protein